ncbi:MAG: hypothetical protein ABSG95_02150 [Solirubrobacteraceae bacterium]
MILLGGGLLLACIRLLGSPVGDLLFRGHPLHPFPAYAAQVMPKPAQLGRFVVAILIAFAGAGAILAAPRGSHFATSRFLGQLAPFVVVIGQLAVLAVAVWAWQGQNEGLNHLTPVQFHLDDLLVAILIATTLIFAALRGWLAWTDPESRRRRTAAWAGVALIVTALWLAPTLYRSLNLAHSMAAVWYPLQFTFDDFMSVLDGRTPLVNYDTQYASLMPFVTEPVFKLFGASVGTFTTLMWALSLLSFMCVERSLAVIARNERTALLLYVPLLGVSLFTLRHVGDERYFMANYYQVMPIRYVGPYVLFWCSVCHLRGSRPRQPALLFTLAGLVAINNTEFGIPALGGCLLALASARLVPRAGSMTRLRRLGGELVLGLILAAVVVSVFTLLRAGSLPQFSRLTRYQQIYAITGFNLVPTPSAGLHIIIFMTFVATLIVAALRMRSMNTDRVMTGALVFSGTFGMGAGSYYMGRSFPEVLAALFPAWGLATALLCLLALQALRDSASRRRIWPSRALPVAAALVLLGLFVTSIDQFPAPWTQWRRLTTSSHTLQFNTAPAVRFVQTVSQPGEHVALLTGLGHLIGRDAGVIDVSPYSHPDGIVTYEQLDEVISALRASHGDVVFTGSVIPEVRQVLTARGFRVVAQDPSSALSEWRDPVEPRLHKT